MEHVESTNSVQSFDDAHSGGVPVGTNDIVYGNHHTMPTGGVPRTCVHEQPVFHVIHLEYPEKFQGTFFKRWQQNMLFFLSSIGRAQLLIENPPMVDLDKSEEENERVQVSWQYDDYACRGHILECLDNSICDVYCNIQTTKALWMALDKDYRVKDVATKNFIVGKFLDFKMLDTKTVVSQVLELQGLFIEMNVEGMTLSEWFQVTAMIDKLPPAWRDFPSYLKQEEMSMRHLIVRHHEEEDNRESKKKSTSLKALKKKNPLGVNFKRKEIAKGFTIKLLQWLKP